jgi:HD-like signal output (HDOD) protein
MAVAPHRVIPLTLSSNAGLSVLSFQSAHNRLSESMKTLQSIAPLPRVCAELARLTAQQTPDAAPLSRLIHSDPALAGEVMRLANSPALRPRSAIVSLQQAVSWLGVAEVRGIAMAVMLRGETFVAPGRERESEKLWQEAWLAALWAKEIARQRRKQVESAFLAALMHRSGAALALKILSDFELAERIAMDARTLADLIDEFEPALGRQLMNGWRLPTEVQDAACEWRNYRESSQIDLAGTVHAGHLLATHTLHPQLLNEAQVIGSTVFEQLEIFPDDRGRLLARLAQVRSVAGL